MQFKFCPECGQRALIDTDGEGSFFCTSCRYDFHIFMGVPVKDPQADALFDELYPPPSAALQLARRMGLTDVKGVAL